MATDEKLNLQPFSHLWRWDRGARHSHLWIRPAPILKLWVASVSPSHQSSPWNTQDALITPGIPRVLEALVLGTRDRVQIFWQKVLLSSLPLKRSEISLIRNSGVLFQKVETETKYVFLIDNFLLSHNNGQSGEHLEIQTHLCFPELTVR